MEWTEKYRPETLSEVCGNEDALQKLESWADSWEDHKKAVILYGRPGIGKTTAAHALSSNLGWQSIEMNASEQRTKDIVEKIAGSAANTGTLQQGTSGQRLVILDEADSLHGNVDRGGTQAITSVVKDAEQPVVLIANEFYDMSRGLRGACRDIEFDLVDESTIARHLRSICEKEGVEYTDDALKAISQKADGDVRAAVNDLQAVTATITSDAPLTVDDLPTGKRDRTEDIYPFLDFVLKTGTPNEALQQARNVDETPDMLFNWVEDKVIKEYTGEELTGAYKALSRADEWLGRVQATQEYTYWKYVTDNITAGVAGSRNGTHRGFTHWGGPQFYNRFGRNNGTRSDIARRIASHSRLSTETARNEVLPYLQVMTHHCKNRELTTRMTAQYDLDASEIAFITGSGEGTNKVSDIISDAEEKYKEAALSLTGITPGENSGERLDSKNNGVDDTPTTGNDPETHDGSDSDDTNDGATQTTLF